MERYPWTSAGAWQPVEPQTLGEKAAALAKAVVNAPYLGDGDTWGGKGWDPYVGEFVAPAAVFTGYHFWNNKTRANDFGAGLDCSGLVMWAFDRANDPTKSYKENIVKYEGADGQYRNNLDPTIVAKPEPGDLLFFSADGNPDNRKYHVAMYVSEEKGFEIVEALDRASGIVVSSLEETSSRDKFIKQFRRIASADIGARVDAASPVDLIVTDPDGFAIDSHTAAQTPDEYLREIPGELYYSEMTLGHDGKPADSVYSPVLKNGTYHVQVTPDADALPTDTYSLTFTAHGNATVLADNAPISSIPTGGLLVQVANGAVTAVTHPDITPPTTTASLSGTAGTNGWYTSTVSVTLTADDSESGVATSYSLDNGVTWMVYNGPFTISQEGSTTIFYYSIDHVGNREATGTLSFAIDTSSPVITASLLATTYLLNQSLTLSWSASDAISGIATTLATLDGQPISNGTPFTLTTLGDHIFTVVAHDNAGNTATSTQSFGVRYSFSGFQPPVKADNTGIYKQGRTLPVKFSLADALGTPVATAHPTLYLAKISNGITGTDEVALSTSAADTGNTFRYDSTEEQYIFNLATGNLTIGTWRLKAVLDDGTSPTVMISIR